jgi:hypothetical protein
VGFRESETNIAARRRPRKYNDGFKAFVGTYIGFAAIDLELVCLNGNLELAGAADGNMAQIFLGDRPLDDIALVPKSYRRPVER